MLKNSIMKFSIGCVSSCSFLSSSFLPQFQVVIIVYIESPITSGTHPPCITFRRFAPQNERSIDMKNNVTIIATGRLQCHNLLMATYAKTVVITIVVVTAIPYAAARLLEVLKLSTNATVAINRVQFI